MRKILATLCMAGAASIAGFSNANAAEISNPEAVIELFTSQGCYSCPPADKLMGKFGREGKFLTLSWHVDYWDYLGWKDIFANPDNTQRQYGYARSLQERQVYTPQAIINGRVHSVGSDGRKIKSLVKGFKTSDQGLSVPISISKLDDEVNIKIDKGVLDETATLHMVFFNESHDVEIPRGENAGKTLTYHNVVHRTQPLGLVKADGFDMSYPLDELMKAGYDGCALLLQTNDDNGNPAAIIGAAVISDL